MTFAFHDSVDVDRLGEWQVGRRRIGQEHFRFGPERGESRSSSLTELAGLVDWAPIEKALADIHSAAKGVPQGASMPTSLEPANRRWSS